MSGHTAGPWTRDPDGNGEMSVVAGRKNKFGFYEHNVIGGCGCCGSPSGVMNDAQREADLSLIVSAPTMLSAIEQFEKWWIEVGQVSFNGAPACVFALREAAALARGES
jgi:hypothetical protein